MKRFLTTTLGVSSNSLSTKKNKTSDIINEDLIIEESIDEPILYCLVWLMSINRIMQRIMTCQLHHPQLKNYLNITCLMVIIIK